MAKHNGVKPSLKPVQYMHIVRLFNAGKSIREIAERFGGAVTTSQITYYLRRRANKLALAKNEHKPKEVEHGNSGSGHEADAHRLDQAIAYCYGHCQTWLEIYATSAGLSPTALASGVADLLHGSTRRALLGSQHRVPALRGAGA